jgi:hypothetical protein
MADGIRKNVASISKAERDKLLNAILQLNQKFYPGNKSDQPLPGGVSYWFKQDEIHQATHVHHGPAFLPWHRELCNRFEALLREVDPDVSLHYWDWTTDPRASADGAGGTTNLLTPQFMGSASGRIGAPFGAFDHNNVFAGSREQTNNAADPPMAITREVMSGPPSELNLFDSYMTDAQLMAVGATKPAASQFHDFRVLMEDMHDAIHSYIGGTIGNPHSAFEDPFVYLLHSNVDRLFASWQRLPGKAWRLDPNQVYGSEGSTTGARGIMTPMEPWAGIESPHARPWAAPENQQVSKNCKHPSVVSPPAYDVYALPAGVSPFNLDASKWASAVKILFGVTDDGPGLVIGPGGDPQPVDPWGPARANLAPVKQDIILGLALTEIASLVSTDESRGEIHKAGVKLMSKSLDKLRHT